jgi:hypothetical protein
VNRGNYHEFTSTIWLYVLAYDPLTLSVSNERDRIIVQIAGGGVGLVKNSVSTPGTENTRKCQQLLLIIAGLVVSLVQVGLKTGLGLCAPAAYKDADVLLAVHDATSSLPKADWLPQVTHWFTH